jgi:hypothetical protein
MAEESLRHVGKNVEAGIVAVYLESAFWSHE